MNWRGPFLVAALSLTTWASGTGEILRTDPKHLPPVPENTLPGASQNPPLLWPKKSLVVIRDHKTPWRKSGKPDRALTLACSAGRFTEVTAGQYRAVFSDELLGVAFGHGLNLHDPDRRADPKTIYLFYQDGTNACQVLTRPNPDQRLQGAGAAK